MGLGRAVKEMWDRAAGVDAAAAKPGVESEAGERKTLPLPLTPLLGGSFRSGVTVANSMPKPTAANLRRFAEMPVARRAINCVKDRIACMDWRVEVRPGAGADVAGDRGERVAALVRALSLPNEVDSFRTLIEQVIEDVLVGGFGAMEVSATGEAALPVRLYAVDGASIQVNAAWVKGSSEPRYGQLTGRPGEGAVQPLADGELMYVRLNPRTHTVFGLGKVEVAFESIAQFLSAHRYAGRLAGNSVVQYALWMAERTPEQHQRLIEWWQDEVEGTGRVPVLSSETKPEVLKFSGGTDADLRLQWQEFLITMIANAFDLPPMMLGMQADVNRSTAATQQDESFQSAVVPVAKLIADHITRDVIAKALGWDDLRFCWSDLESRDESVEVDIQTKLLAAGVLTVDEVRRMRGLPAMKHAQEMAETLGE